MAGPQQPLDLDRLREVVRAVAGDEGLDLVVLFGSSIRDESSPEDLDLAVRGRGPLDLTHLTNRLCVALERSDVDLIDLRRSDPLVLRIVAEEGVLLHEAEAGALTRFASLPAGASSTRASSGRWSAGRSTTSWSAGDLGGAGSPDTKASGKAAMSQRRLGEHRLEGVELNRYAVGGDAVQAGQSW